MVAVAQGLEGAVVVEMTPFEVTPAVFGLEEVPETLALGGEGSAQGRRDLFLLAFPVFLEGVVHFLLFPGGSHFPLDAAQQPAHLIDTGATPVPVVFFLMRPYILVRLI